MMVKVYLEPKVADMILKQDGYVGKRKPDDALESPSHKKMRLSVFRTADESPKKRLPRALLASKKLKMSVKAKNLTSGTGHSKFGAAPAPKKLAKKGFGSTMVEKTVSKAAQLELVPKAFNRRAGGCNAIKVAVLRAVQKFCEAYTLEEDGYIATSDGMLRDPKGRPCRWLQVAELASAYFKARYHANSTEGYALQVYNDLKLITATVAKLIAFAKMIIREFCAHEEDAI